MQSNIGWKIVACILVLYGDHATARRRQRLSAGAGPYFDPITIPLSLNISLVDFERESRPAFDFYANLVFGVQSYKMIFDTGTDEIWIPYWNGANDNLHHKGKDPSTPIGYIEEEGKMSSGRGDITYKSVNMTGAIWDDSVTLTGNGPDSNQYKMVFAQNFLAVQEASSGKFKNRPFDGVFGLPASSYGSEPKSQKLGLRNSLKTIYHSGEVVDPSNVDHHFKFSFWYDNDKISGADQLSVEYPLAAELTLGGFNGARADGPLKTHQVVGDKWEIQQTNVYSFMDGIDDKPKLTRFDTGVYFMVGPADAVGFFYGDLNATQDAATKLWRVDCGRVESMGDLTFEFDKTSYALSSKFYITEIDHPRFGKYCIVNIIQAPSPQDTWILGISFLRAFYIEYDSFYGQINIANPKRANYE